MRKVLAAGLMLASVNTVAGHEVCGKRTDIVEALGKQFGESVRFEGITKDGQFLELLYSDKSGTYTAVMTNAGGLTCVIGSGIGNRLKKRRDWAPSLEH